MLAEVTTTPNSHTAAAAAATAERLLAADTPMVQVWRHAIAQLLDDYTAVRAQHGAAAAAELFRVEPPRTSDPRVDAALAALAEHLSRRDGWPTPAWACDPSRESAQWWFVTPLTGLHARVLVESPLSFRKRGVFISADGLSRV